MTKTSVSTPMSPRSARPGGPAVIGYCRLSKAKGERGLGLAAQRRAITTQAKALGLPVAAMHTDDGVSGAASIDRRHAVTLLRNHFLPFLLLLSFSMVL